MALLRIEKIETSNLKNVEALAMAALGDLNDVYTIVDLGSGWSQKTATLWEAGDTARWVYDNNDKRWCTSVVVGDLMKTPLTITVMDENKYTSHVLIGKTDILLGDLIGKGVSERKSVVFESDLIGSAGVVTGHVKITVSLEEEAAFKAKANFKFAVATLRVVSIIASDMPNVEALAMAALGDKNDAYAIVSFGGNQIPVSPWNPRTATIWESGESASWTLDQTDSKWAIEVTKKDLENETLKIVLMDDNKATAHVFIGKAEINLTKVLAGGLDGKDITIDSELRCDAGNLRGRVSVSMNLTSCIRKSSGPGKAVDPTVAKSINTTFWNQGIAVGAVSLWSYWNASTLAGIFFSIFATKGSTESFVAKAVVAATMQAVIVTGALSLVAHRVLGYLVGLVLRNVLSRHVANDPSAYNIHVGWISLRGIFDKQEIVIHDLTFHNHSSFDKSPFLLHLKELVVSINVFELWGIITKGTKEPLVIDRVILDDLEIYFEKAPKDAKYAMNVFACCGITDAKGVVYTMINVIVNKILEKMDPLHVATKRKSLQTNAEGEVTEFSMEIRRLVIFDILAHPLDLLSASHMEPTPSTDIRLSEIVMHHRELTKDPKEPGGPRLPLTGDEFGDVIGNKIAAVLFGENSTKIANLISATSANRIAHKFKK